MEESRDSNHNQLNSGRRSKIKKIGFYIIVVILYLAVLSPSIVPTYFYFTPEKLERRNNTSGKNVAIPPGLVGSNISNSSVSSYCNEPLIPQELQLYNLTVHVCVPQCGWTPLTEDENDQINATTYTACFIAIISLAIVLMTWCKVPEQWKFPHFIIVIMLIESTTIVCVVSVASLLGNSAFCSSKFLAEASKKATSFCLFEGALLHCLSGSIALWFVVYNVVVATGLVSQNPRTRVSSKWQFIISAAICWILPIIPVIIVLNSSDSYSVTFYSNYCFPGSSKMLYYTAVLPENVLFGIGVTFLFVIVWKLMKEKQASVTASTEQAKIRQDKMNSVVKRLTLLMVFYSATVYLTYGSMAYLLNKADALQSSLTMYFRCLNVQQNCAKDYRKYVSHIPMIFNYIAAGIFPLATVFLMAGNEKTRRFWKTSFHQLRSYISQHSSSSTESKQLVNEEYTSERQLTDKTS